MLLLHLHTRIDTVTAAAPQQNPTEVIDKEGRSSSHLPAYVSSQFAPLGFSRNPTCDHFQGNKCQVNLMTLRLTRRPLNWPKKSMLTKTEAIYHDLYLIRKRSFLCNSVRGNEN